MCKTSSNIDLLHLINEELYLLFLGGRIFNIVKHPHMWIEVFVT
jgi:hypothetical protein